MTHQNFPENVYVPLINDVSHVGQQRTLQLMHHFSSLVSPHDDDDDELICRNSVSQNKVPPKVWFFSGKFSHVISKYYKLFESLVYWLPGELFKFLNSVQAINVYVNFSKVSQFCLCTRFWWFSDWKCKFQKSVIINIGVCFTHLPGWFLQQWMSQKVF